MQTQVGPGVSALTSVFIGRTGVEAEPPIFWPPDGNS